MQGKLHKSRNKKIHLEVHLTTLSVKGSGLFCHHGSGFGAAAVLSPALACSGLAMGTQCAPPYLPGRLLCLQRERVSCLTRESLCHQGALRMTVPPGNLNTMEKPQNMTSNECFPSRSTVLQGQPFGGIPTVLFLNIFLWVVSPGLRSGW